MKQRKRKLTAKLWDNNFWIKENNQYENSPRIYVLFWWTHKISEKEYWDKYPKYANIWKRIHKETWNEYDKEWYNKTGFNENWYNRKWLDYKWHDKDWYDEDWYDQFDFNRDWINRDTRLNKDREWHTREFYS